MKKLAVFLVSILFNAAVYADMNTSWRQIQSVGCHTVDTTCFVEISGNPIGPNACRSNSFRWDRKKSPNGDASLSLLTAAFAAGYQVSLQVPDQCYQDQPNYPTFIWFNVKRA
ncbi:hypothetical protein [Zooshikella sp. RANM57]|uniref:hypothetical protein n=1 Tax=Zooshikella sp. RANM57 TaxID=3425863 RepID=UPI003D6E61A4